MDVLSRLSSSAPRPKPWATDLAITAAVAMADVLVVLLLGTEEGALGTLPAPVAVVAVLLMSAPLLVRRSRPTAAMVLTGGLATVAPVLGIPLQALAPLVALYAVAAYAPLADAVVSTLVFFAVMFGMILASGELLSLYYNLLIVLSVAVAGRLVQVLRAQAAELRRRAEELERTREEQQQLAVRAERNRIAREMHDILAHSTSVMVVQATGARRVVHRRPDTAAQALEVIEETGRETLAEMRRMLGVLRDEADEQAPTRPQPTLADLPELVAEFVDAGLPVELRGPCEEDGVEGQGGPAAPQAPLGQVGLAVYRIVQEALTNILKHAAPSRVLVDVRPRGGVLHVEVLVDGGTPAGSTLATTGGGYGLVGMKERAAMAGGTLEAAPRPTGGFRVAATFPLPAPVEGVAP